MMDSYTVVLEKSDNGYAAYLPDLPGCVAAGDTLEETKALIAEAVSSHLEILASDHSDQSARTQFSLRYEVASEAARPSLA